MFAWERVFWSGPTYFIRVYMENVLINQLCCSGDQGRLYEVIKYYELYGQGSCKFFPDYCRITYGDKEYILTSKHSFLESVTSDVTIHIALMRREYK